MDWKEIEALARKRYGVKKSIVQQLATLPKEAQADVVADLWVALKEEYTFPNDPPAGVLESQKESKPTLAPLGKAKMTRKLRVLFTLYKQKDPISIRGLCTAMDDKYTPVYNALTDLNRDDERLVFRSDHKWGLTKIGKSAVERLQAG